MTRYQARKTERQHSVTHPWCVVGPNITLYCGSLADAYDHAAALNAATQRTRSDLDRLYYRATIRGRIGDDVIARHGGWQAIAGPRGVLP